jgi:ribose 5-phosphate isomerase B
MRIAVGSDERTPVTDAVIAELRRRGHELDLRGFLRTPVRQPLRSESDNDWPAVARAVAEAVVAGQADEGILFCWTGTGVSMAANKVPGIRAALCADAETARGARLWNDANVLCLSLRRTSEAVAQEILDAWFNTSFVPNDTDNACLAQLAAIEKTYRH